MPEEAPSLAKLLSTGYVTQEDGDDLLQEDGSSLFLLESGSIGFTSKIGGGAYVGTAGGAAKT